MEKDMMTNEMLCIKAMKRAPMWNGTRFTKVR